MSDLRLVLEPPIARIVLDRPQRRNAMSAAMWRALAQVCAEVESDDGIDAVLVEGAGGNFCSGADIAEFDEVFASIDRAREYLSTIECALEALCRLDRPTLAKMSGSAIGGGLAIALACDLRFAGEDIQIAAPPAKLGLLYGPVETRLLVETIGPAAAKDMLFSARTVGADEALQLGLVSRLLPAVELDKASEAQAREWAALSATSIRGAKRAVRAAQDANLAEVRTLVERAAMGADFREGRAAFKEKRRPRFSSSRVTP